VSNVGGSWGLFAGMSIVTFIELLEFLLETILWLLGRIRTGANRLIPSHSAQFDVVQTARRQYGGGGDVAGNKQQDVQQNNVQSSLKIAHMTTEEAQIRTNERFKRVDDELIKCRCVRFITSADQNHGRFNQGTSSESSNGCNADTATKPCQGGYINGAFERD
jgi:hypothetical protein